MRFLPLLLVAILFSGCMQLQPRPETAPIAATHIGTGEVSVAVLALGVAESRQGATGLVTPAVVSVKANGTGQVLIESPHGVAEDTRQSIKDAARATALVAGVDALDYDYSVTIGEESGPMSGPSAGSQWALAFYVALNNMLRPDEPLRIRDSYAGTGTISERGELGAVGGVPQKADAAANHSEALFVYPQGPVYADSGWFSVVDMDAVCRDLELTCRQADTLADLIVLATVPA